MKTGKARKKFRMTEEEWLEIGKSADWNINFLKQGKAWSLKDPQQLEEFEHSDEFSEAMKHKDAEYLVNFAIEKGFDVNVDEKGDVHIVMQALPPSLVDKLVEQRHKDKPSFNVLPTGI